MEMSSETYYNLFLDDCRHSTYLKDTKTWTTVRSYNEFVDIISKKGLPRFISFDHDLAFEHYTDPKEGIQYNDYKEKTGYDCAKWLMEYCDQNKLLIPDFQVHSANPVGKKNIIQLLETYRNNHRREVEGE